MFTLSVIYPFYYNVLLKESIVTFQEPNNIIKNPNQSKNIFETEIQRRQGKQLTSLTPGQLRNNEALEQVPHPLLPILTLTRCLLLESPVNSLRNFVF